MLHLVFKTKRWDTDEIDKQRVLTAPEVLGIDEVHICDKMRLVLTDSEHGTLIDMHPRKTIPTVKKAIHALEGYENIKIVTMDMDTGYRNAVKELIPSAMVVIDRFHVVSHISTATQSAKKQIVENLKCGYISRINKKYITFFENFFEIKSFHKNRVQIRSESTL